MKDEIKEGLYFGFGFAFGVSVGRICFQLILLCIEKLVN